MPTIVESIRIPKSTKSSDKHRLQNIEVGNKTRFEHCTQTKNSLMYLRAGQGHTGGHDCTRIHESR